MFKLSCKMKLMSGTLFLRNIQLNMNAGTHTIKVRNKKNLGQFQNTKWSEFGWYKGGLISEIWFSSPIYRICQTISWAYFLLVGKSEKISEIKPPLAERFLSFLRFNERLLYIMKFHCILCTRKTLAKMQNMYILV